MSKYIYIKKSAENLFKVFYFAFAKLSTKTFFIVIALQQELV